MQYSNNLSSVLLKQRATEVPIGAAKPCQRVAVGVSPSCYTHLVGSGIGASTLRVIEYFGRVINLETGPDATMRGMERPHIISNCWFT